MKVFSLLVGCCLMFWSTMLIRANSVETPNGAQNPHSRAQENGPLPDCGGEPCDAVARGFRAFFDGRLKGLGGNGRACADCHMATDNFQLSPASVESRFRLLQLQRRFNPHADDPLFRPVDADDFRINGNDAMISATCGRTVWYE